MRFRVIKHCPVRVVALSLKLLGIKQGVFYEQDFVYLKTPKLTWVFLNILNYKQMVFVKTKIDRNKFCCY
jgi:hypothetical protein